MTNHGTTWVTTYGSAGSDTRLLARGHRKRGLAGLYELLLMEIPHFVMQRKMLLGIKQRAGQTRSLSTSNDREGR